MYDGMAIWTDGTKIPDRVHITLAPLQRDLRQVVHVDEAGGTLAIGTLEIEPAHDAV